MESDSDSSADFLPDSIKRRIQQENVSIKKPVRKQPEKSIEAQLKEISKYKANAENAIKYHEKIKELELEEIRNSGKGFKLSKENDEISMAFLMISDKNELLYQSDSSSNLPINLCMAFVKIDPSPYSDHVFAKKLKSAIEKTNPTSDTSNFTWDMISSLFANAGVHKSLCDGSVKLTDHYREFNIFKQLRSAGGLEQAYDLVQEKASIRSAFRINSALKAFTLLLPYIHFSHANQIEPLLFLSALSLHHKSIIFQRELFNVIESIVDVISEEDWLKSVKVLATRLSELLRDGMGRCEEIIQFYENCKSNPRLEALAQSMTLSEVSGAPVDVSAPVNFGTVIHVLNNHILFNRKTHGYLHSLTALRLLSFQITSEAIKKDKSSKKNAREISRLLRSFHNAIDDKMGTHMDRTVFKDEALRICTVIDLILSPR